MKVSRRSLFCVLCVLTLARAGYGTAVQSDIKLLRERAPAQRPTLLVLGSVHFDNPGRDVVNISSHSQESRYLALFHLSRVRILERFAWSSCPRDKRIRTSCHSNEASAFHPSRHASSTLGR
jgi:hypothetical protein